MSFYDQFEKYDYPLFGYVRLPDVAVPAEDKKAVGLEPSATNAEFLRALARVGYANKITKEMDRATYGARVKRELEIIEKLGFVDYFLLVWKVCSDADKKGIARDYGRGSCAGSLVFYLIDVTLADPIKYNLFFERFISETRAKKKVIDGITYIDGSLAPDVDIDIEQAKREDVIQYLKDIYPNKVCKISTLSTLSGKLLMKECGKVVSGLSEDEMKDVSDLIPKEFGIVWDIEEAYAGKKKKGSDEWEKAPVDAFRDWCDRHKEVYETALGLRDLIKNKGTHPSGYVVAYDALDTFLPVELTKSEDEETGTKTYEISSSFTMEDVSYLTIKLDLLGVRCCSVVAEVLRLTGEKITDINVDCDPHVYDVLRTGLKTPHGLFQIEAPTNLKVCNAVLPRNLSELSDVLAMARPGALSFLSTYVDNECEPIHELFDPILKRTRGVCLYQEQMMQLAHAIGFTLEEAEILRRVVGKKKVDEVAVWQEKIKAKIQENKLPEHLGDLLWKILDDSSKYSFNLSHSLCYASLSALTAYLKFKYPLQFFLALLKQAKNEPNPIVEIEKIEAELKQFGIKLLPPDLLKSEIDFIIEGQNIRFGLSSIKGISEKTIENLMKFKTPHSTRFEIFESAKNAGLNVSVLCALIQCGCLDEMAGTVSRPSMALQAQLWNILSEKEKKLAMALGPEKNFNLFEVVKHLRTNVDEKGKPYIKESRHQTILKKYGPKREIFEQNRKHLELTNFYYERMLLGYSYSVKLHTLFEKYFSNLVTISEIRDRHVDKDRVAFVAVISGKPIERTSVNKNKYAKFCLSDETGMLDAMVFNTKAQSKLDEIKEKHGGKLPAKDSIVFCHGQKKGETVFLDNIADQCVQIYTKFGQIEKGAGQADPVE